MAGSETGVRGTIRVAFLGLAHLHPRSYVPLFHALPDVHLIAAAEANDAFRESFGREFGVRTYSDWRVLLEHEALDLAVLFLPHAECSDAAVACAGRGVHILPEKPMASDSDGILRMIRAAREHNVLLSTPYVWRYHPVSLALKKAVGAGDLGVIFSGEGRCAAGKAHRYVEAGVDWMVRRSQSGGGPLHNLGVHWIDLFRWLLEDEVCEAFGRNIRLGEEHDIEGGTLALLTFRRGAVVMLDISYSVPDSHPGGRELYIGLHGRRGLASWHPSLDKRRQSLHISSDSPAAGLPGGGVVEYEIPDHPGYAGSWGAAFIADLLHSLREGREPAITGEDGLRAMQVVEAVYRSAELGLPVRLDCND